MAMTQPTPGKRRAWSQEERERGMQMALEGYAADAIARALGRSEGSAKAWLHKLRHSGALELHHARAAHAASLAVGADDDATRAIQAQAEAEAEAEAAAAELLRAENGTRYREWAQRGRMDRNWTPGDPVRW